jgi:dCTP deaminase
MAVLTGPEIIKEIDAGRIEVSPFKRENVGSNSVDLSLGRDLVIYTSNDGTPLEECYAKALVLFPQDGTRKRHDELREYLSSQGALLDMRTKSNRQKVTIPDEGYMLLPGRSYLGRTVERIASDVFVPQLHGRSSVGRLFISVHHTAGWGDTGFGGTWTLEITCQIPVIVYPDELICQVSFESTKGEPLLYRDKAKAKYQDQTDPTPSLFWRDTKG